MPLTDTAIKNAKPGSSDRKMADGGGLYLQVTPSGGKLWRLKYRIDGREKKLAIGKYPDVTLAEARQKRDDARRMIAAGKDPSLEKKRTKLRRRIGADNTFGAIADEYCEKQKNDESWAPATATRSEYLLSLLRGSLWSTPIADIEAIDVYAAVKRIQDAGNIESAHRTMQLAGAVFRHAILTGRLSSDPTRDLRGGLAKRKVTNYAAIVDPDGVGQLMRAIEGFEGQPLTKLALQLSPHVFVRPGELRTAEWSEVDFDAAVWSISAHKTKMRKPHHVPLSRQSLEILRAAHEISGPTGYVFFGVRTRARPLSENTINAVLRRLGYGADEMTAHGFRSMASTLLNESKLWHPDAIERALAHGEPDKVKAAYDRSQYWDERVKMAQWWSDYLDGLREGVSAVASASRHPK